MKIAVVEFAQARSGDKADKANVALFAPNRIIYQALLREVTTARVAAIFGDLVLGPVERFEAANVLGLNFVLHAALGGGGARSLRSDALGKSYGALILRMAIEVTASEVASL